MLDNKLLEVISSPPDSAFSIVTQGDDFPHVVNSWNSYIRINRDRLLIPAGRMTETEKNILKNKNVLLTISNREVEGKSYKGTGFLVKGKAEFIKEGTDFDTIRKDFPWARAALVIEVIDAEQTL